jgi:hypothetical protein
MAARDDRIRSEAISLWEELSPDEPPRATPSQILEAAMRLSGVADYERICSPWLRKESLTWAVYREQRSAD